MPSKRWLPVTPVQSPQNWMSTTDWFRCSSAGSQRGQQNPSSSSSVAVPPEESMSKDRVLEKKEPHVTLRLVPGATTRGRPCTCEACWYCWACL